VAVAGNVEIDLTRVHVGAGTSLIEVKAIMGAVTIVVPPWLRVQCDGNSIVGGFEITRKAESTTAPDAPLIRVTGTAFMGAVDVRVVDPNARGWLDRLTG
jgi:predicted membrane protein